MSELLKRFAETEKPRPAEARKIPTLATDFFDMNGTFSVGFTTFERKGNLTNFNDNAMAQYHAERKRIVIPDGFVPTETGITLSRWTPQNRYYQAGQGR